MIYINAKAQGKERPRFTKNGIAYTPRKTREFEKLIRSEYIKQGGKRYGIDPVQINIELGYKIPSSTSKIKSNAMMDNMILPCKKPDLDNVAKAICDALNGVAYEDDKQICKLIIRKRYYEFDYMKIDVSII